MFVPLVIKSFPFQMGAYHTVDVETNRKFTLTKNCWDSIALDRIERACDPTQNADVAAVVMQEGIAHVCLVTGEMTLVRAKIDVAIPRKRKGLSAQHDKVQNLSQLNILRSIILILCKIGPTKIL